MTTQTRPRNRTSSRDDARPRPKRWWPRVLGGVLVVGAAAFLAYREWGGDKQSDADGKHASSVAGSSQERGDESEDKAAVKVRVVKPRKGGITRTTTQPGVVHAYDYVRLYAKVSGFLRAQVVDIGDTVEDGQLLATVFAPEFQQAVEQAAAAVEEARSQVARAESQVTVAKAEVRACEADVKERKARVAEYTASRVYRQKQFVRYTELAVSKAIDERAADEKQDDYESARGGENVAYAAVEAAQSRLEKAVAEVEKTRADVKVAQSALRVAEAKQTAAQITENYTRLTSPFNGVVTERNYHDGDFIRAADTGSDLPPILTLARTDLMRVVLYVPDSEVPYVDRGDKAIVRVDALRGEEFKGEVSRFSNVEMASNRTMRVEIDLRNPLGRLREGMYGNVTLLLDAAPDVLALPAQALSSSNHGEGRLFIARDGLAHERKVRVGRDNGLVVEVLSGLSAQDEVIVDYSGTIEDGSPIEVHELPGG